MRCRSNVRWFFAGVTNPERESSFKTKLLAKTKGARRVWVRARASVVPLFHTRGILKIEHLYEQSLRIFSYKLFKNKLPREVSSLFRKIEHSHNTRCAKNNLPVTRANKHSIQSIAPTCWNSLSLDIKQSPSIASFKVKSKNDLLATYATFTCKKRNCPSCIVPQNWSLRLLLILLTN